MNSNMQRTFRHDTHPITIITFNREGVAYSAVEQGHLTRDSVIMALLKRKVGKYAYVHHKHEVR